MYVCVGKMFDELSVDVKGNRVERWMALWL